MHLCDTVLSNFPNKAKDKNVVGLRSEITTLRQSIDTLERFLGSGQPKTPCEEGHYADVKVLMGGCKESLKKLRLQPGVEKDFAIDGDADQRILGPQEVGKLRSRYEIYIQVLQMSLQTLRLCVGPHSLC